MTIWLAENNAVSVKIDKVGGTSKIIKSN